MFKQFKALGVAGLTTLSASQLAVALPDNVLWSPNKANGEVTVSEIKAAAQAISQLNQQRPLVRFTHNGVGGTAVVPLLSCDTAGRCSPDFDLAPFQAEKGNEVWAHFEFLNIGEADRDLLAFAVKADKPGYKDRYRINHDIGVSRSTSNAAMMAMITPPTDGDYGYYFMDRGLLKTDDLLVHNPGAAIKITVSNHPRGNA